MAYVQAQLEYGKLWRALEFGDKLDKLLQVSSISYMLADVSGTDCIT